jgi:hypothetical protein
MNDKEYHPLTDAHWAMIRGALFADPVDAREPAARRRTDEILWGFLAGKSRPGGMTFDELADLGERFIAGIEDMYVWHGHFAGLMAEANGTRPGSPITLSEPERMVIQRLIDRARDAQRIIDNAGPRGLIMPDERSRNHKPWLREAVSRLENLWTEIRGEQRRGDKKQFIAFAAAALAPLKENVSEQAVATMLRPSRQRS